MLKCIDICPIPCGVPVTVETHKGLPRSIFGPLDKYVLRRRSFQSPGDEKPNGFTCVKLPFNRPGNKSGSFIPLNAPACSEMIRLYQFATLPTYRGGTTGSCSLTCKYIYEEIWGTGGSYHLDDPTA